MVVNFVFAMGFLLAPSLAAQCPPGDVTLNTQADVLAFASSFPDCTDLPGSLTVIGNDVTDLGPASGLQSVGGHLVVLAVGTANLAFPELTDVGTNVSVSISPWVSEIAFVSLEQVGGTIYFQDNHWLTSLQVPSLRSVGGSVGFLQNPLIESLDLGTLESVGDGLAFIDSDQLTDIDVDSLEFLGGGLYLWGNGGLRGFEAPRLDSAAGVFFWGPSALESARFPALRRLDTWFIVLSCQELVDLDFPVLESVGEVRIENNAILTRLDLPADPAVTSSLSVRGNPLLADCCGLLSALATADPDQIVIEGNAAGCRSVADIETACLAPPLGIPIGRGVYRWLLVALLALSGLVLAKRAG